MTIALAAVSDLDCVASFAPLALDLPGAERYATGWRAILRRVVYAWAADGGLLDLEGSYDPADLLALRSTYARLAEEVEFIARASVSTDLDGDAGRLTLGAEIELVDGGVYRFEVSIDDAVSLVFEEAA